MPGKRKETMPEEAAERPAAEQFVQVSPLTARCLTDGSPRPKKWKPCSKARTAPTLEGLGDAWVKAFTGQNPAAVVPQVVGTVMHEGGTRPAWQWKRGGRDHILLAWPQDQPVRASVLVAGEEGGKLAPVSAVPLLDGLPNDLTVEEVHPWENGLGANGRKHDRGQESACGSLTCSTGGDRDDLTPGITHTFLLAGLAYGLRKALLDEVTITQARNLKPTPKPGWPKTPAHPVWTLPLKVKVAGRHMIMPGRRFCEYQMRAVIEEVQDCQLEKMPVKLLYLSFPFENREPMRLALYVSKMVLGDFEPEKGQEVDAYVWLQARIIDIDQGPQQ